MGEQNVWALIRQVIVERVF